MGKLRLSVIKYPILDYTVKNKAPAIDTPRLIVAQNAYVIFGPNSHDNKMTIVIVIGCLSFVRSVQWLFF